MKFILGKKLGMTSVFDEAGKQIPVTVIEAGPVTVTQVKSAEKDGYRAVQVGYGATKKASKPLKGHLKDLNVFKTLKEFRISGDEAVERGTAFDVGVFAAGDKVKVSGVSKGKGFQGAVKRHGFKGMPASHGHHHVLRHVGSIGQRFPQHTLKGTRMAGRMGGERVSTRGLKVVMVDQAQGLIALKGAVPGRKGTLLEIRGI